MQRSFRISHPRGALAVKLIREPGSNGYSLTVPSTVCALALGLVACSNTIDGPGGPGGGDDDPGVGGSAGTAAGSSGASGAGGAGGSSGSTGANGGTSGASGSTGTGGSVGGGPSGYNIPLNGVPIRSHFVRLTHQQWENSVRDLLKLTAAPGLSATFAGDPPNGTFSNNERALFVTSNHRTDYERAAEDLARRVATNAQARTAIGASGNAANFIRAFGRRAFRRPLEAAEQQRYEALFASAATLYTSGDAFANGVELVVRAMLQSPYFLYRTELGTDGTPLSSFEIASKLSFLLRDTIPDDALLDAAERNELGTPEAVTQRAQTMLDAPEALPVLARYHSELFGLFRYDTIDKDPTAFPTYNTAMNADFMEADRLFFNGLFQQGQGLREILTSTVAFVNAATAPLYGVSASGSGFTQVTLGPERPGFLTRLGFLAFNANLREPDPIHRGVEISHRVLCSDLAPPNGEIPPLPAAMPGQTNRERVTAHTGQGECAGCHVSIINPLGFAFENFDAIGRIRTMDNGKPVNTADVYELATGPVAVQRRSGADGEARRIARGARLLCPSPRRVRARAGPRRGGSGAHERGHPDEHGHDGLDQERPARVSSEIPCSRFVPEVLSETRSPSHQSPRLHSRSRNRRRRAAVPRRAAGALRLGAERATEVRVLHLHVVRSRSEAWGRERPGEVLADRRRARSRPRRCRRSPPIARRASSLTTHRACSSCEA